MRTVVGVDGCRGPRELAGPGGSWIAVWTHIDAAAPAATPTPALPLDAPIHAARFDSFAALLAGFPADALIAIDVPIGLPARGPRRADRLARDLLGPRRSSVFPAPIRPVFSAPGHPPPDYRTACARRFAVEGKRMSKQAFFILPKIAAVDAALQADPASRLLADRIVETHPEVSFAAMNGTPVVASKKRRAGRDARRALVEAAFSPILSAEAYDRIRKRHLVKHVAHDDLLDAFAALWTGLRHARGASVSLPDPAPRDACGLPMRIVY